MNQKIAKYGVTPVKRPKVRAIKYLDLRGEEGKKIIAAKTEEVICRHSKTFAKLALF